MNVLFLLTPKANCTYIYEDYTIRQTLERLESGRYASIPILKRTGEYVGTLTEGDLLWAVKNNYMMSMKDAEVRPVLEVPRRKDYQTVPVTTDISTLLDMAVDQNFVPIVDDKDSFIGIVTRQRIMRYGRENFLKELAPEVPAPKLAMAK